MRKATYPLGIWELTPKLDKRQSFYGKALVKEMNNNTIILYSYYQPVCWIANGKYYELNGTIDSKYLFSQTTLRHIREFLYQYLGLENVSLKELKQHIQTKI